MLQPKDAESYPDSHDAVRQPSNLQIPDKTCSTEKAHLASLACAFDRATHVPHSGHRPGSAKQWSKTALLSCVLTCRASSAFQLMGRKKGCRFTAAAPSGP